MNAHTKPPLILTHQMRQDAYQRDTERAALRRDMREVHRLQHEARRATLAALKRAVGR